MSHKIVVYQDEQPQEDGTVLRPWVAASAEYDLKNTGDSPRHALRMFRDWLKVAMDDKDNRVALRRPEGLTKPPRDPEDPGWPFETATERGWTAKGAKHPAWAKALAEHDDPKRLVYDPLPPIYPPALPEIVARFEAAKPLVIAGLEIPPGFDIRGG